MGVTGHAAWAVAIVWIAACSGCREPDLPETPVSKAPAAGSSESANPTSAKPPPEGETADSSESRSATEPAAGTSAELKLDGISFMVPAGWKRVEPQSKIIEAEYELPRASGDIYDGRLTLMSSGGDRQEVLANRTAEFKQDPGASPSTEMLNIDGVEATWFDIRGEWKGPSFRPIEPRADYRMLLLIIPFSERSSFYAKLTGPRSTVAEREEEFREFVRSARFRKAGAAR